MDRARALAPDDPRVLRAAAELAERRGQPDEARRCLEHGRERHPGEPAMHLRLAELEMRRGRTRQALADLRRGLEALPDQPDLLGLLAEIHLGRGELTAAGEVIDRLRRPGSPPGLVHYLDGLVLLAKKDRSGALRTLEEVARSPECPPALAARAWLVLGGCHGEVGDVDRQREALRRAVDLTPSSAPARLALAAALAAAGQGGAALEQYREVVQLPQGADDGCVPLGRLLVQRNRPLPLNQRHWDEVDQAVERAARLPTQEGPLLILRAEVLEGRGGPEQARALLEEALERRPKEVSLWAALADLLLRQGEVARAAHVLDQAQTRVEDRAGLRRLELDLCSLHDARTARRTMKRLEKELEGSPPEEQARLLVRMAAAYYQLGEAAEGRRLCRLAARRAPADLAVQMALLDVAVQGGDEALLADCVADVRRLEGEAGGGYCYGEAARLLLRAQRGERDGLAAARALVAELVRSRPNWPPAALLEAHLREVDGEPARAADAYLRAFHRGERRPGVVERLVQLLAEQGRLDEADAAVRKFQQQALPPAELARLGAEVALRLRNTDRTVELARLAAPPDGDDPRRHVWFGQVLTLAGRHAEAEEALRRAVRLGGDLPETWLALIAHLARTDRAADAEEAIAAMRRQLPAGEVSLALAVCAEALGRVDAADSSYRAALAQRPDDGAILQRAASFYLRLDRAAQAEPLLRRMLTAGLPLGNQVWARRQLALLLAFAGGEERRREAAELLDQNQRAGGDGVAYRRARAFLDGTRPEERRAALRRLEDSARAQPFTADELFRLVQLYEADGDVAAARERMLDLLAADPRNPEHLAHHIAGLLRRGKTREARPWVDRLDRLEPGSPRVQGFRRHLRGAK
jgi:tetratricopeptide (TPR) repeat protein